MYHLLPVQSGKEKKKNNNNIQSPLFDFSADIGQDPEQIILEGCLDAHDRKRSLKIITLMVKRPNACATLTTYNQQKRERKRDYSPKDPQYVSSKHPVLMIFFFLFIFIFIFFLSILYHM
jgi:hypothetical protein